jgi:hypothetical protein
MSRHTLGVIAAVAVAAVLLLSGVAKLAAPVAWKMQARSMGVRWRYAAPVPLVELATGALLAAQVQRHVVAWVAVALFVAFTLLLARLLARGERPPCACFGSWSVQPISGRHVVRNLLFVAVAAAAALL